MELPSQNKDEPYLHDLVPASEEAAASGPFSVCTGSDFRVAPSAGFLGSDAQGCGEIGLAQGQVRDDEARGTQLWSDEHGCYRCGKCSIVYRRDASGANLQQDTPTGGIRRLLPRAKRGFALASWMLTKRA